MKKQILILLTGLTLSTLQAQDIRKSNPFSKKLRLGVSWNQYWGTIKGGDLAETYFAKPCIGYNLVAQYYPVSFLGVGLGWGFQQRGAGIITPDKSGGSFTHPWESPVGDPDSTYRRRLRYNALEIPVSIMVRSPRDIIKGVRPSAAAGVSFVSARKVHDFFNSVEDGFHTNKIVNADYTERDLATQFSVGADIDSGGAGLMQVHFVYTRGTGNVYASGQGKGHLITYGFRVTFLY